MTALRIAFLLSVLFALVFSAWRPSDGGGPVAALEGRTLDARFAVRGPRAPPEGVAILAVDDATLAALDAFPPPRDALADAVVAARDGGARVIAFDLLLVGEGRGDDRLAAVLSAAADTVLAISLSEGFGTGDDAGGSDLARHALSLVIDAPEGGGAGILAPDPAFARHAGLAHVNIARETDGALRRIPLALPAGDDLVLPSLSLEAARRFAGIDRGDLGMVWGKTLSFGARTVALSAQNEIGVNFYGPRGTVPTHSLIRAGEAPLEGRVVFVGAGAQGFGDRFATPYDRQLAGVEVLATAAANLLDGSALRRDGATWGADIVLALLAGAICVLAASRAVPLNAVALTVLVWLAVLGTLQLAFVRALWLDGVTALAALSVATMAGAGARWLEHRRHAGNLARYQSPLLSDALANDARPAFDGRRQKAAALFVDAADFTPRTARLGPERTTAFLRDFHACVERAALDHGGVIEHYAGDGAMICFGLPEPREDDARRALRCAAHLFGEIEGLSAGMVRAGDAPLTIRIGLHYGEVSVAVLGGRDHGHVTMVGDVVNLASRLQEVAKEIGADLVASDALVSASGEGARHGLVPWGERPLRGSARPLAIWARRRGGGAAS